MRALSPRTTRGQVAFFALFVLAALVEFAIILASPIRPIVDGFSSQLASVSAWLIGFCGGTCFHHDAVLSNAKDFSMVVRDGCNGVNVVILLWAAILAYPTNLRWKLTGLATGLAAIQILNLLRLISLYYLGQFSPALFEFAHLYLWETLIIIDAIVVFSIWTKKAAH